MANSASASLLDGVSSFLTAAINNILHGRGIYPREVFERRRHFDVPVHITRHPELSDYIALAVRGARELMARGEAQSLVVVVLGPPPAASTEAEPPVLERFVFDLALRAGAESTELRGQLRGVLVKLNFCDSFLLPLPTEGVVYWPNVYCRQCCCLLR